jgi:hypothetical protein
MTTESRPWQRRWDSMEVVSLLRRMRELLDALDDEGRAAAFEFMSPV